MGNTSSSSGNGHKVLVNPKEPLGFHRTHSDHVRLFNHERQAQRVESFCKGICFSARPIPVNEAVSIRCSHISTNWSGFLRVGFSAVDPVTRNPSALPRYACPDMTNQPDEVIVFSPTGVAPSLTAFDRTATTTWYCSSIKGIQKGGNSSNWAKALPERFGIVNNVITYYVNRLGDVYIALNGEPLNGPFFSGVNVSTPLWALIDIYGNATGVEFVEDIIAPSSLPTLVTSPSSDISSMRRLQIKGDATVSAAGSSSIPINSPSQHHARHTFLPLHMHLTTGRSITLNPERTVATRRADEYSNAYIFTERALKISEKIVIQVVALDTSFTGGLTVGITACNPASLASSELPDDSDQLLDRPEYWVVHKDVVTTTEVGDELGFTLTNQGEIQFYRNTNAAVTIMHIDKSIPVWLFWDLYGQFSQIKLFGAVSATKSKTSSASQPSPPALLARQQTLPVAQPTRNMSLSGDNPPQLSPSLMVALPPIQQLSLASAGAPPRPPRLAAQRSISSGGASGGASLLTTDIAAAPVIVSATARDDEDESAQNQANECTVCFERACNCVVYTCGHMCMCYDCAVIVKASADPLCPICRQKIVDVIRIYKS